LTCRQDIEWAWIAFNPFQNELENERDGKSPRKTISKLQQWVTATDSSYSIPGSPSDRSKDVGMMTG
jgi:hypothetical protein